MEIYTVQYLPDRKYKLIGVVRGSTVQTKNIVHDIGAVLKNLMGGEINSYTELLNEARRIATLRMAEEAEELGADGIIGVTFSTSAVMQGAAEIIVYGTAVKFEDEA